MAINIQMNKSEMVHSLHLGRLSFGFHNPNHAAALVCALLPHDSPWTGIRGNPRPSVDDSKCVTMTCAFDGTKSRRRYTAAALTAFGEPLKTFQTFFTGKPEVEGLGRVFLYRNYRSDLAKWQTADPLGYPDGWNQLAYCENRVTECIDFLGGSCGYEYIWHEYKDCTFETRPGTAFESVNPPRPTTQFEDVIRAIESLNGLTVTHRSQSHVYKSLWDYRGSSKEWHDDDYTYREEYFQQHQFVSITSYVTFAKSSFLDVLGDIATGVGGAIEIVRILFPSLSIPGSIASGMTLTGFVAWVGENLTGDSQRVDIMVRYKECWTDLWKTEYWHILE